MYPSTNRIQLITHITILLLLIYTTSCSSQPLPPSVRVLAGNYTWAENLHFDRAGELFTTELTTGTIYKIVPNGDGTFQKVSWLSAPDQIDSLLGLASDPEQDLIWTAGHQGSTNFIASVSTLTPNTFKMICIDLPKKGNGLMFHEQLRQLYVTSEGNFLPGDGSLYQVDINNGSWTEIPIKTSGTSLKDETITQLLQDESRLPAKLKANAVGWKEQMRLFLQGAIQFPQSITNLWGADGLWIDQTSNILYVGELFTGNVYGLDLMTGANLGVTASIHGLSFPPLLDDFTLSQDDSQLVGCMWWNKSIVTTDMGFTTPNNPFSLLSGINSPTSIRWGPPASTGSPWSSDSLFISEGQGLFSWQKSCRILEIQNAAQYFANVAAMDTDEDDSTFPLMSSIVSISSSVPDGVLPWQSGINNYTLTGRPEGDRTYHLYVPSTFDPTQPTTLVLGLHGLGDDAVHFAVRTNLTALAEAEGFLFLFPQGTQGDIGTGWNAGTCCVDESVDDLGFISTIIGFVNSTFIIRPDSIHSLGFSNGGFMTESVGCHMSDIFQSIASVSGDTILAYGSDESLQACDALYQSPASILHVHGTLGQFMHYFTVPFTGELLFGWPSIPDDMAAWAKRNACPLAPIQTLNISTFTNQLYQGCGPTGQVEVELVINAGGGHIWPMEPGVFQVTDYILAFWNRVTPGGI